MVAIMSPPWSAALDRCIVLSLLGASSSPAGSAGHAPFAFRSMHMGIVNKGIKWNKILILIKIFIL
jgi:hypothetical protein